MVQPRQRSTAVQQLSGLELIHPQHPARAGAEHFVAAGFERFHDATVKHYMPGLFVLADEGISACLGVRPASERLFLEQYLDVPVEEALGGPQVKRSQIAEIGNLVSNSRHATVQLFIAVATVLHRVGYQQMVFCATRRVATILKLIGAPLKPVVEADGRRLGDSLPEWGRYYDHQPTVMHLNLADVVSLVQASPLLSRYQRQHHDSIETLSSYWAHTAW